MNTISTREGRACPARQSAGIALRYAGAVQMAGTLQPDTGEMTWTTDAVAADEPDGTFAVVDGVSARAYRSGGTEWLRIGPHTRRTRRRPGHLEVGLSAQELVLVTAESTLRLRGRR